MATSLEDFHLLLNLTMHFAFLTCTTLILIPSILIPCEVLCKQVRPDVVAVQVMGDILMGKRCDLKTDHGAFWRRFAGEQSPEDLETAMQLVHKLFTTTLEPIPAELDTYMR